MKIIKWILISIAGLLALIAIVGLIAKKEYTVVREVTINKPKHEIYEYIKYLKNQKNYSKWEQMDPNVTMNYTGTDAEIGFVSAWDSKLDSVGAGEQEIKKMTPDARIDYEIRFKRPFENTSGGYLELAELAPNQTKVTWGFNGKMPFPFNVMLLTMDMDKMLGRDLTVGLNNLRVLMEAMPTPVAEPQDSVVTAKTK